MSEQLRLFVDDPSPRTPWGEEIFAGTLTRCVNGHAGAAKLLRDLVRRTGLAEEALAPAAALVLELDAEAGER